MAYMDRNTSLTDEHRTMDTVRQEVYDKLYHYKRYIEDAILKDKYVEVEFTGIDPETDQPITKTRKGVGSLWARWAEFKSDPTNEQWLGLTQGNAAAFLRLPPALLATFPIALEALPSLEFAILVPSLPASLVPPLEAL